jgi:hypothetical protein
MDVVDGAHILQKLIQGGQQRLGRMAFLHGEGIVDDQDQIDRDSLAGLKRFGRDDARLADAEAHGEVLGPQVLDGLTGWVKNRDHHLRRLVRGLGDDLR